MHRFGDLVLRWRFFREADEDSAGMSRPDALGMQTRCRQKMSPFLVRYRSALKPQTCAELAMYDVRIISIDEHDRYGASRTVEHVGKRKAHKWWHVLVLEITNHMFARPYLELAKRRASLGIFHSPWLHEMFATHSPLVASNALRLRTILLFEAIASNSAPNFLIPAGLG